MLGILTKLGNQQKPAHREVPYHDLLSCAYYCINLSPAEKSTRLALKDFFNYVILDPSANKTIFADGSSDRHGLMSRIADLNFTSPAAQAPIAPELLHWLKDSCLKIILHNQAVSGSRIKTEPRLDASSGFDENFKVCRRPKEEKLIPVLSYISGIDQRKALNAHLNFITVTSKDYLDGRRLPQPLDLGSEIKHTLVLLRFLNIYAWIKDYSDPIIDALIKTSYEIFKSMSTENRLFIKERFSAICNNKSVKACWARLENASYYQVLKEYQNQLFGATEMKVFCDFSAVFIALTVWYGGQNLTRQQTEQKLKMLKEKFHDNSILEKINLNILPIDFSFARKKRLWFKKHDEHKVILAAMRSINSSTRIQSHSESLAWARDIFAWLDDDFRLSLHQRAPHHGMARGLLNEGGNIIPGRNATKFILVSKESIRDNDTLQGILKLKDQLNISLYFLPGGFAWTRNPETNKDICFNLPHIDTVINIIPAECTLDNRIKVIIDPYYRAMLKGSDEFSRFLREQDISGNDIVEVDKEELYLNLPNFSVLKTKDNETRLLFNRNRGRTLRKLNLDPRFLVLTNSEIVNVSAFYGNIRCLTNMVPESHLKKGSSILVQSDKSVPEPVEDAVFFFLTEKSNLIKALSLLWVSNIRIRHSLKSASSEFDALSRTLFISLGHRQIVSQASTLSLVEKSIIELIEQLSAKMGITVTAQEMENYFITPLSSIPEIKKTGYYLKRSSGKIDCIYNDLNEVPQKEIPGKTYPGSLINANLSPLQHDLLSARE